MKSTFSLLAITSMLFVACGDAGDAGDHQTEGSDTTSTDTSRVVHDLEKNGIRLVPLTGSPEFPGASLTLEKPEEGGLVESTSPVFKFDVSDYELGSQTEDRSGFNLANSGMGQHIHVIVDNEPYTAHYHDTAMRVLSEGDHLLLAFLSRSYHESVKSDDAYILRSFTVGNNKQDTMTFDMEQPYLFYSRPKGSYKGEEIKNLLLDFYPVNAEIGDQYKVKVNIDGTEFTLDKWQPYVVQGLQPGDHTFRIQLVDAQGNLVPGKFTDSGNRIVSLQEN